MSDEEIALLVDRWFNEHHRYFKLNEYYGIDILAELRELAMTVRDYETTNDT